MVDHDDDYVPKAENFRARQIETGEWIIEERGLITTDPERWMRVAWRGPIPSKEEAEAIIDRRLVRRDPVS